MKCILSALVGFFFFGMVFSTGAQNSNEILILDLGSLSPGESTVLGDRENRDYNSILLLNIIPGEDYKIEIEKEVVLMDPLQVNWLPSFKGAIAGCSEMESQRDTLLKLAHDAAYRDQRKIKEKGIKEERDKLTSLIRECTDQSATIDAKAALLLFQKVVGEDVRVRTGEKVVITVKRAEKSWKFILRGRPEGEWVTTYGFSFLFSDLGKKNFVSEPIVDSDNYTIKEKINGDVGDLEYIPAVFFSYFPAFNTSRWLNHSLTGGLGFDGASPVVMLGYSVIYRHNLGLSTGVAFHQQQGLKGEYGENQVISSDLSFDQLHDPVYRPNIFFSVQFRLGQNPFKEENDIANNN